MLDLGLGVGRFARSRLYGMLLAESVLYPDSESLHVRLCEDEMTTPNPLLAFSLATLLLGVGACGGGSSESPDDLPATGGGTGGLVDGGPGGHAARRCLGAVAKYSLHL